MQNNENIRRELGWDLNQPYIPPTPVKPVPTLEQINAARYVAIREAFVRDMQGQTPIVTALQFDEQADRLVAEATK